MYVLKFRNVHQTSIIFVLNSLHSGKITKTSEPPQEKNQEKKFTFFEGSPCIYTDEDILDLNEALNPEGLGSKFIRSTNVTKVTKNDKNDENEEDLGSPICLDFFPS